ncbi:HIRAN domain-containing protein [Microbacterium sp. C7(2022)]|uniref:HIRAN domain-containing protein n=1 Tax=Microbacterium sp. C7(2022) TaxID=2992759 RepID=UPI00237B9C04|nr:HIRAN domain-containing protein [Microbacterium sp. C7(2022)]MDE0545477.1 HIRAN domain-containing protein [Microbacterium sp. C7(2022)]
MGTFRSLLDAARSIFAGSAAPPTEPSQATPEPPAERRPRKTSQSLARQLVREFPYGVDAETLWDRCEAAGLEMADVDRAIDDLARDAAVKVERIDPSSLTVVDLLGVDAMRMRIKGSVAWVTDTERARYGGQEYLLVREPDNEFDAQAIAVYGRGRKVGYVPASKAAALAPLLDALEADAYLVAGAAVQQNSIRLWVDVPRVPALRSFVAARPS